MTRKLLFILLVLLSTSAFGQEIEAGFRSLAGSNKQLPFWLWANQLGRYERESTAIQNFRINASYRDTSKNGDWNFDVITDIDLLLGKNSDFRFTELYGGLGWKILELKAGAFAETERFNGLSASNGNLASTRNPRPHPKIRAGFNQFVPVLADWFSVYGFYEEGLLNDDRYVENTHLHRKAFYFRFSNKNNFSFTVGAEHFVMWGGTHPVYGELLGWEAYWQYVFGKTGGEDALPTDQKNIVGNHFGTYQLEFSKKWDDISATLFISHPYEDQSGLGLINYRDNLYGLFIQFNETEKPVQGMLLEYYYTKHQSGAFHMVDQGDGTFSGRGKDNYFNHGVYRSGVTYHGFAQVSPFWGPIKMEDGVSMGFASTRLSGIHAGANGNISNSLHWKSMISYIKHFGNYDREGHDSYDPPKKMLATMVNLDWQAPNKPILVGVTLAADHGNLFDEGITTNRLGIQLNFTWNILP